MGARHVQRDVQPPLVDLHSRYFDAYLAVHHLRLYGFRPGAFTYPPITAYVFVPFRVIGWHATGVVWTIGNVVVLALLFAITLHKWFGVSKANAWLASALGLAPAAIFLLFPFRSLLYWGQFALFLLFLVFVDLFVVPARFRGILIGVATAIKLLPALFVVWLLARRDVPSVIRVGASFLFLTLLAAVLYPHASAQYWLHILPSGRDVAMVADPRNMPSTGANWAFGIGKVDNQSIRGLLGRPPISLTGTMPWLLLALVVLGVGIVATIRLLSQRRDLVAFVTLSVTTVLISPVSWVHYWVFAGLAPFVAILEWRRDRAISIAAMILTVAMCANMEDPRLDAFFFTGAQFSQAAHPVVFVIRNLYVLGGLVFLAVVTWRALATQSTELDPPLLRRDGLARGAEQGAALAP